MFNNYTINVQLLFNLIDEVYFADVCTIGHSIELLSMIRQHF